MKVRSCFLAFLMAFCSLYVYGQTDDEQVRVTLMNYIEGSSYSEPNKLKAAFHEQSNLYLTKKDNPMWIVPANEYISWYEKNEQGTFTGRIGNVLFIDVQGDIATAKAEIIIPKGQTRFVDAFLLKKIDGVWKIISKTATKHESNATGKRVLFIVSNADVYGKSDIRTGNSFAEIVKAYHTFQEKGYIVDFVSPNGGAIPLAYINTTDPIQKQYLYNTDFMDRIKRTQTPEQTNPANYLATYYVGGGAAMYGVPENEAIQSIVMRIYEEQHGVVASVCHGTAGIVHLKTKDGKYLVDGKKVNGYPESYENQEAPHFSHFPFLIQKTIEAHGGKFKKGKRNTAHVEVDGRLVTGQNHLSSTPVALKMIELIEQHKDN